MKKNTTSATYLTYTLFEYLHYIKEPSDIPLSTTCLRFTACLR